MTFALHIAGAIARANKLTHGNAKQRSPFIK